MSAFLRSRVAEMADSIPRAWLTADESAAAMLARMETERPALFLPPLHRVPIRAGNVVEITGPSSSAKTHILLQAAVACILPKEWNGVHFGGLERVVAYIDLDCRFDVLRLYHVLKLRIMSAHGSAHGTHGDLIEVFPRKNLMVLQADLLEDELLLSCMKRFFYIRCYNSSEFLSTLKTMHSGYISSSGGLAVNFHILIIDSIGAFHWNDRACQLPTKEDQTCMDFYKGRSDGLRKMIRKDGAKLLYREYMSPVWQSLVTHKVHLGISDVASSDGKQTYICEWIQPPVNILEKFVVNNNGISIISQVQHQ